MDAKTFESSVLELVYALMDENVTYRDLAAGGSLADRVKSCSKGELSQMLFPNRNPRSSLNQFNRWLSGQPQLRASLRVLGWHPARRQFTAQQSEAVLRAAKVEGLHTNIKR